MGVYDTVSFDCKECGERLSAQSKAGPCSLKDYSSDKVPLSIAMSLKVTTETCHNCGTENTLTLPEIPSSIKMTIKQ